MNQLEVELVEHTPGSRHSGIGRYTRELYRHLAPRLPTHLTTHLDPPLTRFISTLHHLPLGVRAHKPGRIVHFVEDLGCSQMLWRPVRPAVATSHDIGMLAWEPEATMHRPWDRQVWRLSYRGLTRMDGVIAVSAFSRDMLVERLGLSASRVHWVHSGVDRDRFRPIPDARAELRRRWKIPGAETDRYVLYVGTEIPRKNMETLLRALRRLPPHVRLLKAGSSGGRPFREATRRNVRDAGLAERVVFIGEVSEEDLVVLYGAADAYVCCSFLEGFGQPVLEAMACGTPVVSSNAGALPEVVGDAAILVGPRDDRAVAEAVMSLLNETGVREQMIARGLARAARFTWDATAAGVLDVYREVWERSVEQ